MALLFNAKKFTIDVITDLQALLAFMDTKFGHRYDYGLKYFGSSSYTVNEELTLEGTMIYFFVRLTKRPYPEVPTADDIKYINAIWDTLGYPEKKLAME
jgi:hypothetical protein